MKKQLILTLIMTSLFTQNINSMAFFKKNPSKALLAAVKKADYENVKKALDQGALLDLIDKHGRNAFELALESAIDIDEKKQTINLNEGYTKIAKILAPHATNIEDAITIATHPDWDPYGKIQKNYLNYSLLNTFLEELRKKGKNKENIFLSSNN